MAAKFSPEQLAELDNRLNAMTDHVNDATQIIVDALEQGNLDLAQFIDDLRSARQDDDLNMLEAIEEVASRMSLDTAEVFEEICNQTGLETAEMIDQLLEEHLLEQAELMDGSIEALGISLTDRLEAIERATRKQGKKTRRTVREEAEETRNLIRATNGSGLVGRPWNWLIGVLSGSLFAFVALFIFKIMQFSATAHCVKLNFLNYTSTKGGVKVPMCDPNPGFFSSDFWYNGEGYFAGISKDTGDNFSICYYLFLAIMIVIFVAVALTVAYAIRRTGEPENRNRNH